MKGYYVIYNIEENTKNGRRITKENQKMYCEVRGKNLDSATIYKRLENNLKTWQSAGNKCGAFNKAKFIMLGYEEKKLK